MTSATEPKFRSIQESVYEKLIAEFGDIPEAVEHNQYEERLEERRDRLELAGEKAVERSNSAYERSHDATKHIPLGQPIIVGGSGEKAHRRALKTSWGQMGKSVEEQRKSEYYADKAAAVGTAGIDSTDPDAIRKLMLRLLGLQIEQEVMKAANVIIRSKAKKFPDQDSKVTALGDLGFSEAFARELFERDSCGRIGFPSYKLQNNNANMKRIKSRIKSVSSLAKLEDETRSFFDGWLTAEINKDEGRVFLSNPQKPSQAVRDIYRRYGFNWRSRDEVWSRKLTAAATRAVGEVRRALTELGEDKF